MTKKFYLSTLVSTNITEKSGSGRKYYLQTVNEQPEINPTLKEIMEKKFGLQLPEYDEETNYDEYIKQLKEILSKNVYGKNWRIKNFVTFGFFPFSDIIIHKDLSPELWGDNVLRA